MLKYRHLFFDLDNTLYNFEANSYMAMKNAFQKIGLLELLDSFDAYFETYIGVNDALWADYRQKKISKEYLRGKRHEESLARYNITSGLSFTKIDDIYLEMMTHQTELFPDALEVLSALKQKGYLIHIITNGFKEVQHEKIEKTKLAQFVTDIYISEDIKAPKPSRAIFEYAIKSSNARKNESIMIGDSWESDIVGAKKFGIDQVFFRLNDDPVDYGDCGSPTFSIYKLSDLLEIF
ncbi:MAG: YjjG family noncanonical pyrimidine nucleotidase [Prolixibacteraceae bacterium]|jgi:putative hydrolase of the HAD superfamily|nr:YjjG family noncanonical pyrimidine nucleotidase [Prolixibacteraceae bacterium]